VDDVATTSGAPTGGADLPPPGAPAADWTAAVTARLDRLLAEVPPAEVPAERFRGAQFDAGLAWVHFPVGSGGLGAPAQLQSLVDDRLHAAGVHTSLMRNPVALGMAAPVLLAFGTEAQQRRHLRPMFAEDVWCQLFSEPGAGSDLATLSTRAVPDGGEWVVNGQKVWTSLGHLARWGILLARTDPAAVKHRGLTFFLLDMSTPGVEVRPLRQITGEAEFNEVFLTDVRIPDSDRLGAVGDGWSVALATLMNERLALGSFVQPRGAGLIGRAVQQWQALPERPTGLSARRDELAGLWAESEVLRLMVLQATELRDLGTPGPEGAIAKLVLTELRKRIAEFSLDLLGEDALVYGTYELGRSEHANDDSAPVPRVWLRSRAHTVEGGTTEVMKNILAERILGLPRDRPADKGLAWSEIPR
jgi:alkylation response protein AidB-like acyl-CoA dehydrogenase